MAKQTVMLDGWTLQLRIRTVREKRKVNGRTRGRYTERKTATAIVTAPNGKRREWHLGTGDRLVERPAGCTAPGGRKTGTKARITAGDTRDLENGRADPRQGEFFPASTMHPRHRANLAKLFAKR